MIKGKQRYFAFFMIILFYSSAILALPTITSQPTNKTVAVGSTATFNITATSPNSLSYKWYKNSVVIAGAISNSYTTPATTLGDNGNTYYCVVTDIDGDVQSNNATLLVGESPVITTNPKDSIVTEGQSVSFTITASGTAPLAYQWRKNGANISGAISATYSIASATLAQNGNVYSCVVTNPYGINVSNNAILTVNSGVAPVISTQPAAQSVLTGQTATFTVVATGTAPLQYQWKKNGSNIVGANSASYTTPTAVLADNQAIFLCVITNNFGTVNSSQAVLSVTDATKRVTSGLQVLYEFEEQSGDIVQDLSGNANPENLTIITPEKIAWTPAGLEAFDLATVRRTVTNSKITQACTVSNEITLEVWIMPEWVNQSSGRILTFSISDVDGNFSILPSGDHYQFILHTTATNGNGEPGLSSSSGTQKQELTHLVYTKSADGTAKVYINGVLDVSGSVAGNIEFSSAYWLGVASAPYGGAHWRGLYYLAAVYDRALSAFEVQHNYSIGTPVDEKPAFTINPKNKNIVEGESLFLDSYAISVQPIIYQWRKNGINIPGANDRFLNLSNLTYDDNGAIFTSTATTEGGHTISDEAIVYITPLENRVTNGLQTLYNFREGSGTAVNDVSGVGTALNLTIFSADAVQWDNQGLHVNTAPTIISTNSAGKITSAAKSSNEISIEAWVSSANLTQTSPARIFTVSADGSNRNFSLGQNGGSYEVNLRTTSTDLNGSPAISSSAGTVSASGFDHVVFTRSSSGTVKFYINGTERVSSTLGGDFSNWNDVYLASLGNEFGVDNHWEGTINLVAVFDRALSNSEVLRNFSFGPYGVVYKPTNLSLVSNEIGKITISWDDNSTNEEGFIIERGLGDPAVYVQIGSVGIDTTLFVDENVVDNKIYSYRVKSYYSLGESGYSDPLVVKSLITPIDAPSGLQYTLDTDGYPIITWDDNSAIETNFEVVRRQTGIGSEFSVVDTLPANTTSYKDLTVSAYTTYVYKVRAFNQDTTSLYSAEKFVEVVVGVDKAEEIPTEYSLSQNYPNPFNPSTTIKFGLPQNSHVSVVLYNLLGQAVMKLVDKEFSAGRHDVVLNASDLPSGIYIYSISAVGNDGNNFKETKKMILLK